MNGSAANNFVLLCIVGALAVTGACKSTQSSRVRDAVSEPYCSAKMSLGKKPGPAKENGRTCRIAPECRSAASDPDGDGWGWENEQSCRVVADRTYEESLDTPVQQTQATGLLQFETTYYPYGMESYFKTTCGDAQDHGGMYFAVTEKSPLWPAQCELDSWADCGDADCLGKWDRLPPDAKKIEGGRKLVREPQCKVPCGKRFRIYNEDKSIQTTAVIYDACPSQHWNNRYKEVNEGRNPCTAGLMHLDLRKPLYQHLNGGKISDNIKVWVDTAPLD